VAERLSKNAEKMVAKSIAKGKSIYHYSVGDEVFLLRDLNRIG